MYECTELSEADHLKLEKSYYNSQLIIKCI